MNTPNPLHPQGTFPGSGGRSHVRIAVFTILAIHVVLLGALLLQGCKRTAEPPLPPAETNVFMPPYEPPTNPPPPPVVIQTTLPPVVVPAPIPPVPPPVPTEGEREHVVVARDSFYTLAKKYNVTMKAIAEANPGVDSTRLKLGQKLKIPAGGTAAVVAPSVVAPVANGVEKTYSVKSGDTLMKIAKEHGTTVKALRLANRLKTDQIKVSQKIKIPAKASAVPAPEPVATALPPVTTPPPPVFTPGATNP